MSRYRLDEALVQRGLYPSRSRARDAVLRGTVTVDGQPAHKPAMLVGAENMLASVDAAQHYVSRAALKLKAGLAYFGIEVTGRACLDVGASTGGFTQVLLEQGAAHVTAIDVGHGQMQPALATNPRVTNIEGFNVRDITAAELSSNVSLIVCDVSFISLRLALAGVVRLAAPGCLMLALVKPQFEVGRDGLGRGGIVSAPLLRDQAVQDVQGFLTANGWQISEAIASPLTGGDGNQEYVVKALKL